MQKRRRKLFVFLNMNPLKNSNEAVNFRRTCRDGSYQGPTAGKAPGFAQV